MPLKPGKENVGNNIREMEAAGHPRAQAIAASLREAGEGNTKSLDGTTSTGGYQDVPGSGPLQLPMLARRRLRDRGRLSGPELQLP